MPKFITVDAHSRHTHTPRATQVNVEAIAYISPAGDQGDPSGPSLISFTGGAEHLVVTQTPAQVAGLIDAALAPKPAV